ncbi:hypothetical protein C1H46_009742 [Malus baccata]|uniref:Uncharacterized protein n=1 Tax=Malus baccata TaxID=106549 RepID=A0A540N0Y5_MALBA|nr:hypothetical protein C1H46_009742 [Malus baccata]
MGSERNAKKKLIGREKVFAFSGDMKKRESGEKWGMRKMGSEENGEKAFEFLRSDTIFCY